jgi:hypothetical protein
MAQAVSRRPLAAEALILIRVCPRGICDGQSGPWDRFFSEFFSFPLSISFHRGSPYSYIIWGIKIGPLVATAQRNINLIPSTSTVTTIIMIIIASSYVNLSLSQGSDFWKIHL